MIKKEFQRLVKMSDKDIDYSDIPEIDLDRLGKPLIGRFYRPIKKPISIRLDADVLEWFKDHSDKYQALINAVCRAYMEKHRRNHH